MPALEPESGVETLSDADIIAAIRAGDTAAVDELYRRHQRAALAFAESIAGRVLAPDLVSDAFLRILDLMQRGGGPSVVFRSYLYTTIRNLYIDHVRHHSRQTSLPDFGPLEAELALADGMDEHFEHSLVKRAFTSLPERWQIALWYTTVEGVSLEDAGTFLGVAPNAVAALTFRAREGLRQAYLAEHLNLTVAPTCAEIWETLPRYVRGTLRARMLQLVEEHLPTCRECTAAVLELSEVNANLRGLVLLALVGAGTAGSVEAALSGTPAPVGFLSRLRHGSRAAQAGVVAGTVAVAAAVTLVATHQHEREGGGPGGAANPSIAEPRLTRDQRPEPPPRSAEEAAEPASPRSTTAPTKNRPSTAVPPVRSSPSEPPPATFQAPSAGPVPSPEPTPTPTASPTPAMTPPPAPPPNAPAVAPPTSPATSAPTLPPAPPSVGAPWVRFTVHVRLGGIPVTDVLLVVQGGSWLDFRVAQGPGLAPWVCEQADPQRLVCRLTAGTDALDLGLELQTDEPGTIRFSLVAAQGRRALPRASAEVVEQGVGQSLGRRHGFEEHPRRAVHG